MLGDLMAPALSEDLCFLAMDVASRYVKVKKWSWYPTELLPGKGGTIVEVGAYLGHKTVAFVDYLVGPNGRVLAIEAMPDNHELLEWNIEKNQLADTVDVLHCGVWSSSGHKELMAGGNARNSLVGLDHISLARRITIPVDTLDHILVNWHRERIIDFLDIRVNGAEVEVLEGLKEQLERVRVVFVAAPYSVQGVPTYDRCREILTQRGCLLLPQTTKTALYATPRGFAEEVLETPPLRVG